MVPRLLETARAVVAGVGVGDGGDRQGGGHQGQGEQGGLHGVSLLLFCGSAGEQGAGLQVVGLQGPVDQTGRQSVEADEQAFGEAEVDVAAI